jgi:hypothetical protein
VSWPARDRNERRFPRQSKAAGHPCAGLAEKETSLGITARVPIAVVVALTGEHLGFVMLAFVSVRFFSGNDRSGSLCCRCFFRGVPLCLHRNCPSDYRMGPLTPIYCSCDVEQADRQRHNGGECHNHTEKVNPAQRLTPKKEHHSSLTLRLRDLIEINDQGFQRWSTHQCLRQTRAAGSGVPYLLARRRRSCPSHVALFGPIRLIFVIL